MKIISAKLPATLFGTVAVTLLAVTLWAAYEKDSPMFATMFMGVLLTTAAVFLFMFSPLNEFSLSALSAQARFVRETAAQAQSEVERIAEQRALVEQVARDVEALRTELARQVAEVRERAAVAYNVAAQQAGTL